MKVSWKGYWQPTPKGIRKIADSILAGATLASTFAVMDNHPKLATWIMIISVITKILSNFLTDDNSETN
jgi:ABC-type transport system involved in cytochrome c biogenesis permease subunit